MSNMIHQQTTFVGDASVAASKTPVVSQQELDDSLSSTPRVASVGSFSHATDTAASDTASATGSSAPSRVSQRSQRIQNSQRLLVRIPSTGAIVIVDGTQLCFGKHKQRGKPLTLCAAFDCADPQAAICANADTCPHVHADTRASPPFRPHQRSAAMLGQYPRLRGGAVVHVVVAGEPSMPMAVSSETVIATRGVQCLEPTDVVRLCVHFSNGKCHRGGECDFAHVVGTPAVQSSSAAVAAPKKVAAAGNQPAAGSTKKPKNAAAAPITAADCHAAYYHQQQQQQQQRMSHAASHSAQSYHTYYNNGRAAPASSYCHCAAAPAAAHPAARAPASVFPSGHHAMPSWAATAGSCPSAASIVSPTWA